MLDVVQNSNFSIPLPAASPARNRPNVAGKMGSTLLLYHQRQGFRGFTKRPQAPSRRPVSWPVLEAAPMRSGRAGGMLPAAMQIFLL